MSEPADGDGSGADKPEKDAKPTKVEVEAAKPAEDAKAEAKPAAKDDPKPEGAKAEPAKVAAKAEPAKAEPANEAAKAEPAKAEPANEAKAESAKAEPAKEAKAEPAKEAAKPEAAKAAAKTEAKKEPAKEAKAEPAKEAKPAKADDAKAAKGAKAAKDADDDAKIAKTVKVGKLPASKQGKSSGVVDEPADIPPTRQQQSPAALSLAPEMTYPDDGGFSRGVRALDGYFGIAEQVVLVAILAAVVLTAASAAISDKVLGHQLGRWWFDIVRGGTFSIAMMGAVFATHQQRHLAMDLISKRLPPTGRLVLRVLLGAFTIGVAALLVRSGLHQLDTVGEEGGEHVISTRTIVMFMPAGAGLIIIHTLMHMAIDIDYMVRGVHPPERARSGH